MIQNAIMRGVFGCAAWVNQNDTREEPHPDRDHGEDADEVVHRGMVVRAVLAAVQTAELTAIATQTGRLRMKIALSSPGETMSCAPPPGSNRS